ncbi:hypothetical protein Nepgr_021795 [Nepenthes gracilis]|uniref:Uncharacterized protein n=1 Tax=Nepenthes gracilis TaxID=150966 RepID=A0AAD3SZU7_NEPGR|nr:hypothetical protein Nepgr_021795 [Nepenthes gracilis]
MPMKEVVRVIFQFTHSENWISPFSKDLPISEAFYDSLKNWKDHYFFVHIGDSWPLFSDWDKVPSAFTRISKKARWRLWNHS